MYSVLLCSAIALVLGLSGFLLDWWSWGWSIPIAILAFIPSWIVLARRLGAQIQPHVSVLQQQMQARNLQGAMKTLEGMLPMAKWVPMLRGQLLAQMGMIANLSGDQDRAIQLLEGASLRAADARLVLACILFKKGDQKRAFEILRLAAAVSKKNALLHNTYAWLLHKTERADEAQKVLATFLKRDPNNAPTKDNLLRLQNRTRMTMQGFDMQWYALGLEQPPQAMGTMRRAPNGFREPPKQRGR